jgi:hypothetical protein
VPLDISILVENGSPIESVGIGVDEHWAILQRAIPESGFPLIQRMADYYEDATFAATEVTFLKSEIERLNPRGLENTVEALLTLLSKAEAAGRRIEAIAD